MINKLSIFAMTMSAIFADNNYPILLLPGFNSNCAYSDFRMNDVVRTTGLKAVCIDTANFDMKEGENPFSIMTPMIV